MLSSGIEKIFFTNDLGENMKNQRGIFYSLNLDDIQMVAIQEIGRELNDEEIDKVKDSIGEKIDWYDAVLSTINEKIAY
jgi:hypothetical protein